MHPAMLKNAEASATHPDIVEKHASHVLVVDSKLLGMRRKFREC